MTKECEGWYSRGTDMCQYVRVGESQGMPLTCVSPGVQTPLCRPSLDEKRLVKTLGSSVTHKTTDGSEDWMGYP